MTNLNKPLSEMRQTYSSIPDAMERATRRHNESIFVIGYHPDSDVGGGNFVYDASRAKSGHNGGTVIDPEKTFPTDWNDSGQVEAWFTADGVESGVWVRPNFEYVTPYMFGATGGLDDTKSIVQMFSSLSDGGTVDGLGGDFTIYKDVVGVTTGDALPLSDIPHVNGLSNVTIKNITLRADSPSVSVTKFRYPSTFALNGCSDVRVINSHFYSKGESWGDTDASSPLGDEARRDFAIQNGGHACVTIRSKDVDFENCSFRLCGSVASYYVMSSSNVNARSSFSNPASLGYAAYAFDSWAGDISVSGFSSHTSNLDSCASSKESYTYGSKGCVITEDKDVTVIVNGGYYADAFPNGSAKDLGYAFGSASSQTIVNGAVVKNCATVGYISASSPDYSYLTISNVNATGLRKTFHQNADVSFSRLYVKYSGCNADVIGGGLWPGDGDLSREQTSYLALANAGNNTEIIVDNCSFTGASYGFINDNVIFGLLKFVSCEIETNGFLYSSQNIGASGSGQSDRGIIFDSCGIRDVSSDTSAYTIFNSNTIYVYVDLSSSRVELNSTRDIETSSIPSVGTYVDSYRFYRPENNTETITSLLALKPESAKIQTITPSGADRVITLPRPDKYKYFDVLIINAGGTYNLTVKDYTNTSTIGTLAPGQVKMFRNNGDFDYSV